jgi:hypothetical protein
MDPLAAFMKGIQPADDAAPAAVRPDASARWRQELERAQWSRRAAERPASSPSASTSESASSRAAARSSQERRQGPGQASAGPNTNTYRSSAAPGVGTSGTKFVLPPGRSVEQHTTFNAVPQARPQPQEAAGEPPQATGTPQPQRVVWQRVNVHAMLRDGSADVWVRDASLERAGRRRLAVQLGERLRAAGLRPGALYLNGEEISADFPYDIP